MAADSLLGGAGAEDASHLLAPASALAFSAALAAVWLLGSLLQPKRASRSDEASDLSDLDSATRPQAGFNVGEIPEGPNIQYTFEPSTGLLHGNSLESSVFENENAYGRFLPLHRPTWDKMLDKSGKYPYADHFKGRKRLWEMRFQLRFKKDVTKPMRFGIELDNYVHMNGASKKLMSITVSALRRVAGSELYHSPGDDPRRIPAPHEKPVFTMPVWAFDQYIITPEGETPPDLSDPAFSEFGTKRVDDRAAFIAEMSELELRAGPTYTFSFWGISQFLDTANWQVTKVIPFQNIDYNSLCGAPPVRMVLYTLRDDVDGEQRHLQTRKDYYFNLLFWSSTKPPSQERLQMLLPRDAGRETTETGAAKPPRGWTQTMCSFLACCAQPRDP